MIPNERSLKAHAAYRTERLHRDATAARAARLARSGTRFAAARWLRRLADLLDAGVPTLAPPVPALRGRRAGRG